MTDTEPPPPKKAKPPAHKRWGTLYARGSPTDELSDADLAAGLRAALGKIGARDLEGPAAAARGRHHAPHAHGGRAREARRTRTSAARART